MGQLRTALRAYALEGNSPGQLIELLNRLVLGLKGGQTATVLYATFDPRAQTLSFAAAGHPPPLLVSADGPARYLEGGRSSALGLPGIAVEEDLVSLERGSTLVLYTDGLVERRGRSIEEGMALLSRVAEEHRGDLESLCDHVMSDSIGLGAPEDDVALLALRPLPISSEPLHLRLRAEPEVLITLRRALRQWLLDLGGEPEEVGEIVLACNEAASNVLEHAYGQEEGILEVGAVCDERNVHITVRDFGQWRVSRGIEHGRGLQLMHSLVDSVEVVRGPTGTEVQLRRRLGPGEAPHQPVAPEASLMAGLEDPGVELVELEREIDLSNVGEMADLLGRAVDNHPLGLVVDLSRTTYLDSAGIRLLFQVAARLERHRQQLRVVVPEGSPIRRVLALTRFESCAPIDPSVEAAMAGIRSAFDTRTQGT
jgi:anti-anti-sigma factor